MKENWKLRKPETSGLNSISSLVATKGSTVINNLYKSRAELDICITSGLTGIWSADYLETYEPAIKTILEHIQSGKPVLVYGDCDVDGITATVALETGLLSAAPQPKDQVHVCIPDRIHRGYGIKVQDIVEYTTCKNPNHKDWLVVTVDCGTNDVDEVKELKKLGFNVIITDHHLSEGDIPEDTILVNPKLSMKEDDAEYGVSGCYIAAKIAAHLLLRTNMKEYATAAKHGVNRIKILDALVALSILSDQIVLNKLNRKQYLAGAQAMNSCFLGGITVLLAKCWWREGNPITSTLLAYTAIPRLNSAGRMGQPILAYNILSIREFILYGNDDSGTHELILRKSKLVDEITVLNQERKSLEHNLSDKIYRELEVAKTVDENNYTKSIVINIPDSEPGILGIVAAKFCEQYKVPTLILTTLGGELKGSGRSPDGYDLYGLLKSCGDVLTGCGGHRVAAGLSLKPEKLEEFKTLLNQKIDEHPRVTTDTLYDAEIAIKDLYDARIPFGLQYIEPIGNGNTAPTFLIKNVRIISEFMKGEVLNLVILDVQHNNSLLVNRYRPNFGIRKYDGRTADVLVELTVNYFGGLSAPEYRLLDIDIYKDEKLDAQEQYEESMMKKL